MTIAAATAVRSWPRIAVETCTWILLAAILLETWFLAGVVVSCRVVGDSMAETLLGVHRVVQCADCGHRFTFGADERLLATKVVCPNCGYAANDIESLPDVPGQRLLIDRRAFSLRRPRRWEVVALRSPRRADEIIVKRVVGLPGEMVETRNGDVFVDGVIQRKNLAEQHALAILVHDAACRPTLEPTPPPRWRAEPSEPRLSRNSGHSERSEESGLAGRQRRSFAALRMTFVNNPSESRWRPTDQGFSHIASDENEPVDWLVYHHWRRLASGQCEPSAVTDVCGYNQSRPRREEDVRAVADLLLSFRLAAVSGRGVLHLRAADGREEFEVRLQFEGEPLKYVVYCNGKPIAGAAGLLTPTNREPVVEMSLIDRQFLLALDGQTVGTWPCQLSEPPRPTVEPLAIGATGLAVEIQDLRVYRDVYYGGSPSLKGLGGGEYYVLGDNSPISDDSRAWPDGGGVDAKLLVGKPLGVH